MIEPHIHHADISPDRYGRFAKRFHTNVAGLQEMMDIRYLQRLGETAPVYSAIACLVEGMNRKFSRSIDLPPTQEWILAGSTSNIDRSSHLKDSQAAQEKIDRAFQDALQEGIELGKNKEQVISEIEDIIVQKDFHMLPTSINNKAQVIGFVLRMFSHSGGRIQVADLEGQPGTGKALGEWIGNTFQFDTEKIGGAASQVSDYLMGIGERNAIFHSQVHSPTQAAAYKHDLKFLTVTGNEISIRSKGDAANDDDPTKINQVIERSAGIEIIFNGKKITATSESDRFIFLGEYYDRDGSAIKIDPILPFSDEVLGDIAKKFKFFFTTAPSYLQRYQGDRYMALSEKLSKQLKILKSNGVKILYEFSGNTTNIRFLKDVLKGNIASFSINDKELKELISTINRDGHGVDVEVKQGDDPITVYNNALALAKYLEVDRLHVHGHNFDISVRRNASEKDLEMEVKALMHAKQRVTEWIQGKISQEKTPKNEKPSRLLKREGYADFLRFTGDLAQQIFPETLPNAHKNRTRLKLELIKRGYYKADHGYSVVIIPVKWVYEEAKVQTSSGDIMAIVAAIHAFRKTTFKEKDLNPPSFSVLRSPWRFTSPFN